MKAMDDAFSDAMSECDYGEEQTNHARGWFDIGWDKALAYAHSPQQAADMAALHTDRDKWYAQASKNQDQIVELQAKLTDAESGLRTTEQQLGDELKRKTSRIAELENELANERALVDSLDAERNQ